QTARISLQISRNVKKQGIKNNPNRAISFVAPSSHLIPELSQIKQHFRTAQSRPEPASPSR
ncbi:hypothetical protein RM190_12345, partial [Paracoccus sp. CPCC 101403]